MLLVGYRFNGMVCSLFLFPPISSLFSFCFLFPCLPSLHSTIFLSKKVRLEIKNCNHKQKTLSVGEGQQLLPGAWNAQVKPHFVLWMHLDHILWCNHFGIIFFLNFWISVQRDREDWWHDASSSLCMSSIKTDLPLCYSKLIKYKANWLMTTPSRI